MNYTREQKRQILELAKETEILLNLYPAEFTADDNHIIVFDAETFDQVTLTYGEFERGLLVNNGKFKT
jgi:hypothetical protein